MYDTLIKRSLTKSQGRLDIRKKMINIPAYLPFVGSSDNQSIHTIVFI